MLQFISWIWISQLSSTTCAYLQRYKATCQVRRFPQTTLGLVPLDHTADPYRTTQAPEFWPLCPYYSPLRAHNTCPTSLLLQDMIRPSQSLHGLPIIDGPPLQERVSHRLHSRQPLPPGFPSPPNSKRALPEEMTRSSCVVEWKWVVLYMVYRHCDAHTPTLRICVSIWLAERGDEEKAEW